MDGNFYPVMTPVFLLYLLEPLLSTGISNGGQTPLTQTSCSADPLYMAKCHNLSVRIALVRLLKW